MTSSEDARIRELVRDRYANLARKSALGSKDCESACCTDDGPSQGTVSTLYRPGETSDLPAEALAASAGCGNPHAIEALQPGETVVDFGCGGGIDCFIAARAVGAQGSVVGIDMTEDMVDLARSNARRLGLRNVEFHLSEMEHTPLEDGTVDAIISNCVINLAPDKFKVFREAYRILKSGGRLMVSDLVRVGDIPEEEADDDANWVECLAGTEMKDVYLRRMEAAGFTDVQIISSVPWSEQGWRSNIHSINVKAVKSA